MPRGGPRPHTGGARTGAGRKPLPRLDPEGSRELVAKMQGDKTRREFAALLGVSTEAIRLVCRDGFTETQMEDWRGRWERAITNRNTLKES